MRHHASGARTWAPGGIVAAGAFAVSLSAPLPAGAEPQAAGTPPAELISKSTDTPLPAPDQIGPRTQVGAPPRHGPSPAHRAPTHPAPTHGSPPRPLAPSPVPQIAAFIPGPLLPAAAPWLQGRNQNAKRLLVAQGVGVASTAAGFSTLLLSGAARSLVGPAVAMTAFGVNIIGLSWLSSLYATFAPRDGFGDPLPHPLLTTKLGYLNVANPVFEGRHFATATVDGFIGPWHLNLETEHSPFRSDGNNVGHTHGQLGYRVYDAPDNTFAEIQILGDSYRFRGDGFVARSLAINLESRLTLSRYLQDTHGAFIGLGLGLGNQWFDFELPGIATDDSESLLLFYSSFGVYLGNRDKGGPGGELEAYYNHRRDGFAGASKLNGIPSGIPGHVGLRGFYLITNTPGLGAWGLGFRAETGSARLLGIHWILRQEEQR